MKITFFICTLSSGGAEHQMSLLANFLTEKGYETEIITFGDETDHYWLSPKIKRQRLAEGNTSWRKVLSIFSFFFRVKTDCVISFSQRANALMLPAMFFRPKLNVIVSERNFTKGSSNGIEKALFYFLYRRANWIVPNSFSQGEHIARTRPSLKKRIKVITNYTDLSEYQFHPIVPSAKIKVGVFSRYAPQKNYERFLKAITLLNKEELNSLEVHWYGNTLMLGKPNPEYESFNTLVRENNLNSIVFAHNSIKNVPIALLDYDVLCLPSLYEGFSNSLSEYICCGRPVLASDVSDNHLMVHEGKNGFLFNPEDEKSISRALKKILSLSDSERAAMCQQSRHIAEGLFDKDNFIKAYIQLIENKYV